jgi:hypothetical protein
MTKSAEAESVAVAPNQLLLSETVHVPRPVTLSAKEQRELEVKLEELWVTVIVTSRPDSSTAVLPMLSRTCTAMITWLRSFTPSLGAWTALPALVPVRNTVRNFCAPPWLHDD